jgi:DNA-binding beta-propeller fold protein YncE
VACASAPACGDGQAAASAQLNLPEAVGVDPGGSVYIADWGDNEIRVVSRAGTMTVAAGDGSACATPPACGDGGPAPSAPLSAPQGVAVDGAGNLFVADTEDHELRLVTPASARPASLRASTGNVSLVAFASGVTRTQVAVRYALTGPAPVTLSLNGRVLARASGHAGLGQLIWNRKLGRTSAPAGRYRLTVTAAVGKASAQSSLTVRL